MDDQRDKLIGYYVKATEGSWLAPADHFSNDNGNLSIIRSGIIVAYFPAGHWTCIYAATTQEEYEYMQNMFFKKELITLNKKKWWQFWR